MEIVVSNSAFRKQRLAVRTAGWFSGANVLLNGTPLEKKKGAYLARSDEGTDVPIRLKSLFGDPIPVLTIGDETVRLARPLPWYEYVWAAIPIVLLFIGGGLGALVGTFTTYTNFRILRREGGVAARFGLGGIASIGAFVVFFILAGALQAMLGGRT